MKLSSYLTRLIWWCLLPLIAFTAWLVYDGVRTSGEKTDKEAENHAHNFATSIQHNVDYRISALSVLAQSPVAANQSDWLGLYQAAQGYHQHFGGHVLLVGADDHFPMIFNTRAPFGTVLPNLPKPPGVAAAPLVVATRRPAAGDIVMGPVAKVPLIAIAVPILGKERISHLLMATFETGLFQARIEKVDIPHGWRLSLLDSQGGVIARSPAGTNEIDAYRHFAVPVPNTPWSVVLEIPRSIYMIPLIHAASAMGLGAIVAILLGIAGGIWGTRRLRKAIAQLSYAGEKSIDGYGISEIDDVRQRIEAANQRIDGFASSQEQAIEQERRRVAREVHDQMGQVFTAIRLIVQSVPRSAYPAHQEAALQQALDMGIASARKITAELRPPLLDDLGLPAALTHFAQEAAKASGLAISVNLESAESVCADQALGLFRIVQEAVTNIQRHAGAHQVDILGRRDADYYRLTIEDDGCGIDLAAVRQGAMGLTNMQERARLMKGQCEIRRRQSGGTCIAVSLPIDKSRVEHDDGHEYPAR